MPGEIHCLAGENGCGKSTLIKIISGVYTMDSGYIEFNGKRLTKITPVEAINNGIQVIYQDFAVFPNLTVMENLALNSELASKRKFVNWKRMRQIAEEAVSRINFHVDLDALVGSLSVAEKQMVAISRALMKVVNIGSINIDYVYQMEHFIQPGETKGCKSLTVGCGGKGLNQSIALAQAGAETYHVGIIGREGGFLAEKLREKGVHTDFVKTGEGASGHAIIQVDENGQNCIITYGGTNQQFTESWIDEVLSHFEAGDIAVLQNEINLIPYIMRFGSLFDATQTLVVNLEDGTSQVQVVSWYDNENSYTSQMVRTIKYFSELR